MTQFGFSTNAFREHSVEEAIEAIGDAGYDGVELLFDEPHLYPGTGDAADAGPAAADDEDVARVKDALDDHDLAVSNCNAFMLTAIEGFHHPSFVEADADYRQERIDYTREAIELAAEFADYFEGRGAAGVGPDDAAGRPHVSIEPGGPVPEEFTRAEAMETFTQSLGQVVPVAEDAEVDVLVEPEPDLLVETTDQFLELMATFDRDTDALGCNFDAGHLYCVGEDPAAQVETLVEYTRHYHLEDVPADRSHEHTQLGDGAMDLDGFLRAVEDSGYRGFVTVELYPYQETPAETARQAMAWLEEHGWA